MITHLLHISKKRNTFNAQAAASIIVIAIIVDVLLQDFKSSFDDILCLLDYIERIF
jgi:hypothetical protein